MILEIGIGIITFSIGLFIGSIIEKVKNGTLKGKDGFFGTMMNNIKQKSEQKREEKMFRKQIQDNARAQALREMQPELIAHMKEQEMKKLTGQDKKEKLEKFANAFSMGGGQGQNNNGFNTNDKINRMLGISQPMQQQPMQQQPMQQQPMQQQHVYNNSLLNNKKKSNKKRKTKKGKRNNKTKNQTQSQQSGYNTNQQFTNQKFTNQQFTNQQFVPAQDPFSTGKINMMLGRGKTEKQIQKDKQSEEDRILNFLK